MVGYLLGQVLLGCERVDEVRVVVHGQRVEGQRNEQVGQGRAGGEAVQHRGEVAVRAGEMRAEVGAVFFLVVEHEERVVRAQLLLVDVLRQLGKAVQAVGEQVDRSLQG